MLVHLTCNYCGLQWSANHYSKATIDKLSCSKCGDSSLKVKSEETTRDYYEGAPSFPEKKIDPIELDNYEVEDAWNRIFGSKK
jgi:hypothetical protein